MQFVEGGENQIDSASIRADGVADIAVDILYRYLDGAGGVARGDLPRRIGDLLLALFKARQVEIANRGFQPRFVGVGAYFVKPDIAFAPFGMLRRLLTIETGDKIVRHQQRIDQHAFGGHRMRRHAGKTDFRRRPVEVFIHHFTQFAAVDGPAKSTLKRRSRSSALAPRRPISSSGTKATTISPWSPRRFSISVITTLTAALLSAPSTLVPSLKIISVAIGQDLRVFGDAQPDILLRVQAEILAVKAQRLRMNIGGEPTSTVSIWVIKPTRGAAGRLPCFTAVTVACASISTCCRPNARSSSASSCAICCCPGVLGRVVACASL